MTQQKLQEIIDNKDWKSLKEKISEFESWELAELIENLPEEEDVIVFRFLPRFLAKATFQDLSHEKQEQIIEGLAKNVNKITALLNDLDPDDRTAFLEELPGAVTKRLIQMLSPDERKIATKLLGYPEDSIGRLMTPEFIAVEPHFTIAETLDYIRSHCQDSETLNIVYVIDKDLHLLDDIPIRKIILAGPEQKISEIMDNRVTALNVLDDQEEAIAIFKDTNMVALPVVDSDLVLLGIVTVDDVMDLVEEETTEDFHKFGAVQDAVLNPMKARIYTLYKQRVFWLTTLVFMNIFSGAAIAHFGDVIQKSVSLLYFLPLLIGSGGNAGAQSATLMIRSLAIGDVGTKDWLKLLSKEFSVSLLLGLTMAAGVSVIASFRAPNILFVVSITMVCTVITGSLIGMLLPFIFTKLKLDPATASAPLITSLADISGVIIYFTFATFLLGL